MTSECFDCSPPIPSGYYAIVNKVNGNIKPVIRMPPPIERPVVADPNGQIWQIEHIKDYEYHILSRGGGPGVVPESTIERDDNLYVDETAIPEVWIICGEHDSTVNKNVYVIKKKPEFGIPPPPPIARKYWNLENPSPGTQVKVIPPPFFPGPGCEVNRIPAVFIWYIEERPSPIPSA